jgi:hypothetical protein
MSRRQIKMRLATPLLVNNRPRACNPARRRSPRNSRKIRQTLAGDRDRATAVPEARAPGTLLQNHPEAATPLRDRRQQRQILQRQDPRRELLRRRRRPASKGNVQGIRLEKALPAVKQKIRGEIFGESKIMAFLRDRPMEKLP